MSFENLSHGLNNEGLYNILIVKISSIQVCIYDYMVEVTEFMFL